jgi:putative hydrolase of the HAD superfamily
MTTVVRACLVDVYDTILTSLFLPRMAQLVEPLGIGLDDWLLEWETMREDRDRGKLTVAQSFERTLRALGAESGPELLADLSRRDAEFSRSYVRLCDDTVPFLAWLRSRGTATALVSNCADTTRALLDYLGIIPLVDAVVLSCEVGSVKPYPEIYVTALEELGVAAVDAVFIDDQPTFCVGAQAVGVRPIQIARGEPDGYASRWDFPVVRTLLEAQPLLLSSGGRPPYPPGSAEPGTRLRTVPKPLGPRAGPGSRAAVAGLGACRQAKVSPGGTTAPFLPRSRTWWSSGAGSRASRRRSTSRTSRSG